MNVSWSDATYRRRKELLLSQIRTHPHRDELVRIMAAQIGDDTYTVQSSPILASTVNR